MNITVLKLLLWASYWYHYSASMSVKKTYTVLRPGEICFALLEDVFVKGYHAQNITRLMADEYVHEDVILTFSTIHPLPFYVFTHLSHPLIHPFIMAC